MSKQDMKYGDDLRDYVLGFGNQSESSTDEYASHVQTAIVKAYWKVMQLEPWWFVMASTPGIINIEASQDVTVNSISGTTVTLSQTIATSQAKKRFALKSNQVAYRILSHTAGQATMTLDASYVETETSGAGVIFKNDYDLGTTVMKIWGPMDVRSSFQWKVDILERREFEHRYGWTIISGVGPVEAAMVVRPFNDTDSEPSMTLRVAPWADRAIVAEFEYTKFHTLAFDGTDALDIPRIPQPYRWIIADYALGVLWRNKNDTLAATAFEEYNDGVNDLRNAHMGMASMPRMYVRRGNSLSMGAGFGR